MDPSDLILDMFRRLDGEALARKVPGETVDGAADDRAVVFVR